MVDKHKLKEIKCGSCNNRFYVDINAMPPFCPYCKEPLSQDIEIRAGTYRCSKTGISLKSKKTYTISLFVLLLVNTKNASNVKN